jgi:hypothetical protein
LSFFLCLASACPSRRTLLWSTLSLWSVLILWATAATSQESIQVGHEPGLIGTQVNDIRWSGRYLWVVTESGLARLDPTQGNGLQAGEWLTYLDFPGLDQSGGGISALDAVGDTVWVATLFDTFVAGQTPPNRQTNAGLHFSTDAGDRWQTLSNEVVFDSSQVGFARGPGIAQDNACFGLAISGQAVWAAFFAGATVRFAPDARSWQRVLPDGAAEIVYDARAHTPADSLQLVADSLAGQGGDSVEISRLLTAADSLRSQALLHRTFEVTAYGDTVWVGTASGIARSLDDGRTWRNFKVRLGDDGAPLPGNPAGNWALSIDRQILPDGSAVIWAGTNTTTNPAVGQRSAMNFSLDGGQTWQATGPTFAWDFAFSDATVWASTSNGLLRSDDGRDWEAIEVEDASTRERLRGTFIGAEAFDGLLWVGAESGLGRSADGGQSWDILKSPVRPLSVDLGEVVGESGLVDSVEAYAAPNPFDPSDGGVTRVIYSLSGPAEVSIRIYDYASRLVRTLVEDEARAGGLNHGENWDGRDEDGDEVANGVYFFRIDLNDKAKAFGKVVVLD